MIFQVVQYKRDNSSDVLFITIRASLDSETDWQLLLPFWESINFWVFNFEPNALAIRKKS